MHPSTMCLAASSNELCLSVPNLAPKQYSVSAAYPETP